MSTTQPSESELSLWSTYLNDHLAGATGALQRLHLMVEQHTDLPCHGELVDLERQVETERDRLVELTQQVGEGPSLVKRALGAAGERIGRLKPNRRVVERSPLSPLLEVEMLRSGVMGKKSLWETLATHGHRIGMEPEEFHQRTEDAGQQLETLHRVHSQWAARLLPEA